MGSVSSPWFVRYPTAAGGMAGQWCHSFIIAIRARDSSCVTGLGPIPKKNKSSQLPRRRGNDSYKTREQMHFLPKQHGQRGVKLPDKIANLGGDALNVRCEFIKDEVSLSDKNFQTVFTKILPPSRPSRRFYCYAPRTRRAGEATGAIDRPLASDLRSRSHEPGHQLS